jgi:hypothetical protein
MKLKNVCAASLFMLLATAATARAQVVEKRGNLVVYLPDLKVSLLSAAGDKAVVRVTNVCKGDAKPSRVSLWIYGGADKKTNYGVLEEDVPALVGTSSTKLGGKKSADVTFSLKVFALGEKIKTFSGKFLRVQADPQDKIKEASEGNNWWEPVAQPFPDKGGYCDPPK